MIYVQQKYFKLQSSKKIFERLKIFFTAVVTDLLMSEAVRYYTRNRKENSSEDSGVESGNSLENNGEMK